MGDVHDSDVVPADQELIFVQKERRAEDLSQDACTDVQLACKDGWDKSDLEYIHEAFESKCKHRCFLLIICIALIPWTWEVPLEGRKWGPQD
jgi:hypothetical protein